MLGTKVRQETLLLSLGQSWVASFFPRPGSSFIDGTYAECVITDPAGNTVTTWEPDSVAETRIDFIVDPDDCDPIPHGSYFRVTAHLPATGTSPWIDINLSRGMVLRDDNPTPLAGPRTTTVARAFADDLTTLTVNPNWVKLGGWGNLKVYDNSAFSLPNGLAADFIVFANAAARWREQTNQNAVKVEVSTVIGTFAGDGKTTVVVASNQAMTSWMGYQLQTGTLAGDKKINIVQGTSPTAYTVKASVSNTVANNDRYTFVYDDLADKYLVYKTSDFSAPLLNWTDSTHAVAHGNGYRYPGLLFESNLLTTGVQLSGWAIRDN